MFLTEQEARRELCPHMRHCVNEADVANQHGRAAVYEHSLCQGARCRMAWRWQVQEQGLRSKIEAIRKHRGDTGASLVDAKNFIEARPHLYDQGAERKGYCGISGRPEL